MLMDSRCFEPVFLENLLRYFLLHFLAELCLAYDSYRKHGINLQVHMGLQPRRPTLMPVYDGLAVNVI
jgi:hypothetical protein